MKYLFSILFACLLSACSGPDVRQYQSAEPKLDLVNYFSGVTDAWGMFQERDGTVTKRFYVEITGTYANGVLTLDEKFKYDDGTTSRRVWQLFNDGGGHWRGTADDVIGQAQGMVAGNALHWQYTLLLPVGDTSYEMQFDDWMFLIDQCTMINRASMRKFWIEFGQVTLTFRRRACAL
jgi:hypothetical protein